jgi:hypothetical protein
MGKKSILPAALAGCNKIFVVTNPSKLGQLQGFHGPLVELVALPKNTSPTNFGPTTRDVIAGIPPMTPCMITMYTALYKQKLLLIFSYQKSVR